MRTFNEIHHKLAKGISDEAEFNLGRIKYG